MPNEISNALNMYGPQKDLRAFREKARGFSPWTNPRPETKPDALNFHSIVPVPAVVLRAPYDPVGIDWEEAHWGTKWGALYSELTGDCEEEMHETYGLQYCFKTAWVPPIVFLRAAAVSWPTIRFDLYYSEWEYNYQGFAQFKGDKWEDHRIDGYPIDDGMAPAEVQTALRQ